ncbi:MAG: response regulator [Desulfovermiculus sp.]
MQILIAEDDDVSRKVLSSMLRKQGHEVVETADGEQAWEKLQDGDPPALLILDIMMPGMDGLQLCRKIREQEARYTPYIILLTAKTEASDVIQGLEAGANDYVTKPYHFGELQARINAGQRMLEMQASLLDEIDKRKKMEESLRRVSFYDGLTQLYSRSFFEEEMHRLGNSSSCPMGVIVCDIDGLKLINDTLVHHKGDELLGVSDLILFKPGRLTEEEFDEMYLQRI